MKHEHSEKCERETFPGCDRGPGAQARKRAPRAKTVTLGRQSVRDSSEELETLIRQQARDRRMGHETERVGRMPVLPLAPTSVSDSSAYDTATTEPGYAAVEERMTDAPRIISHSEAQRNVVRDVIAGLSLFEQDVYYHTFGQGLSFKATAAEMRCSTTPVRSALDRIKAACASALAAMDEEDASQTPQEDA